MINITSKENTIIKEIKKLKDRKYRNKEKVFLIEGFRFVKEALKSDFNIKKIFVEEKVKDNLWEYDINLDFYQNITYVVPEKIFKNISDTDSPQGIMAIIERKEYKIMDTEGFYILIDRIQDPGNLGTIVRTAHAAGANGVILTEGTVDIYNEKTLRSTMGSIFNISIYHDKNLEIVKKIKDRGYKLLVSSLESKNNFYNVNLKEKFILAVGNEGSGVSKEVIAISDEDFKIPMPGNAESLNVSIAASIMIFEAVRQKDN